MWKYKPFNAICSKKGILCFPVLKMLQQKDHRIWTSSNISWCHFILQIVQLDTLFGLPFAKMEVLPWNDLFGFAVNCFSKQTDHLTRRKKKIKYSFRSANHFSEWEQWIWSAWGFKPFRSWNSAWNWVVSVLPLFYVIYSLYSMKLHTRKPLITYFMETFQELYLFQFIGSLAKQCVTVFSSTVVHISLKDLFSNLTCNQLKT